MKDYSVNSSADSRPFGILTKETLYRVIEAMPVGVFVLDPEGSIVYGNEAGRRIWRGSSYVGPEDFREYKARHLDTGKPITAEEWAGIRAVRNQEVSLDEEIEIECFDGTRKIILNSALPLLDDQGACIGAIAMNRDITERKRVEAALAQNRNIESIGMLAGGIAHDFNNLLGGIYGFIELALDESKNEQVRHLLSQTLTTMERARGLTQQLITFSKGGEPSRKPGDIAVLIRDICAAARVGDGVTLSCRTDEPLYRCSFDATQVRQVMEHLLANAAQSMPNGGAAAVSVENVILSDSYCNLPSGPYLKISVSDEGEGISRENLPRIFDPFFSTKESGRGLGLAICHSILRRHGGTVEAFSTPGRGTSIQCFLPAHSESIRQDGVSTGESRIDHGRVLLMDDDEMVRLSLMQLLERLGYGVAAAAHGEEAVTLFREAADSGKPFSAVILDLSVSCGWGGERTVRELRKLDPDVPAFVASGYIDSSIIVHPETYGFTAALQKPFRKAALAEILSRYLESAGP